MSDSGCGGGSCAGSSIKRSKLDDGVKDSVLEEPVEGAGLALPEKGESKKAEVSNEGKNEGTPTTCLSPVSETPQFVYLYQIVKTMLEHAKINDLLQASQVCKQWRDIGRIVRKQRKNRPYAMLFHPYLPHSKLVFEYFNGYEVSQEATELVESGRGGHFAYERGPRTRTVFPGFLETAKSFVAETVKGAYDEPQMIITFGSPSLDSHLCRKGRERGVQKKEKMRYIFGNLQDNIPCLSSISCGLIGTLPDCNKSLEMEKKHFPGFASTAIPKVAGLQVKLFRVTKDENLMLKKCLDGTNRKENYKNLIGIEDENEENLKGILLLQKASHVRTYVDNAVIKYLETNPTVAVAGGIHDSVMATGTSDETIIAAGALIYGDENVRVSSVALRQKDREHCSNKIEELKATMLPKSHGFAFMFACNGRGRYMHDHPNVESDLFNSALPNIPLTGAFTYGEFCHEVLANKDKKEITPPDQIDYGYTTVFLLVSYKHPDTARTQDAE